MARKVFISFLGRSIYQPTLYIAERQDENEVESTRFIQEALVKQFCSDFSQGDKILVFTTEKALENWLSDIHKDEKTKKTASYESLKHRLCNLNLDCKIENVMIPDGESTEEIWDIFQRVFEKIEEKDELIFDITHGFRSLPIFNMVLINYAKLLRNISVKGIYYGNWEASYTKGEKSFSPIWNLIDFQQLQEWTNAAQLFIKAGNANDLSKMMAARNIIGHEEIKRFSQEILSNRGISLTNGTSALAIKNILIDGENKEIHPVVKPIFKLIENHFSDYQENSVLNGLYAVKWCIDHDLIQQGYTLMSEFLPTYVLNFIGEAYDDKDARATVNGFLAINGKIKNFIFQENIREKQTLILNKALRIPYFKKLCERNRSINSQNRDDINHGGFRENPKDYKTFKGELTDKYENLKDVVFKIENEK